MLSEYIGSLCRLARAIKKDFDWFWCVHSVKLDFGLNDHWWFSVGFFVVSIYDALVSRLKIVMTRRPPAKEERSFFMHGQHAVNSLKPIQLCFLSPLPISIRKKHLNKLKSCLCFHRYVSTSTCMSKLFHQKSKIRHFF